MTDDELNELVSAIEPYQSVHGASFYWCLNRDNSPPIRSQGELPFKLFVLLTGHPHGPYSMRYYSAAEAWAVLNAAVEKYKAIRDGELLRASA